MRQTGDSRRIMAGTNAAALADTQRGAGIRAGSRIMRHETIARLAARPHGTAIVRCTEIEANKAGFFAMELTAGRCVVGSHARRVTDRHYRESMTIARNIPAVQNS